jgi:ribosomal protein S18 acetylase RimI-like enzyme
VNFPAAESRLIQADGVDAGWLLTIAMPEELRLAEIMVLAELCGKGIGTAAIRDVMHESQCVRLHVNVPNAGAIRLYERPGFRRVDEDAVQYLMEWAGSPQTAG